VAYIDLNSVRANICDDPKCGACMRKQLHEGRSLKKRI